MADAVLRSSLIVCLLVLGLVAGGCGGADPGPYGNVEGETEATYLELGGLKYQVQLSRQLNPADVEDRNYLEGVPRQSAQLARDEVWFGVFLRVENDEGEPALASDEFAIEDTQENVFRSVPLGPANNFRYRPRMLEPGELIPAPSTPAAEGPIQGALLLFRIDRTSIENRPLEFIIESPVGPNHAAVSLDV
jgi:hypothetical protein